MKARVYSASDYAGVSFPNGDRLYYGYEITTGDPEEAWERGEPDPEWCFEAKLGGRTITIPYSEMFAEDRGTRWSPTDCLLQGIAVLMERGVLAVALQGETPHGAPAEDRP